MFIKIGNNLVNTNGIVNISLFNAKSYAVLNIWLINNTELRLCNLDTDSELSMKDIIDLKDNLEKTLLNT